MPMKLKPTRRYLDWVTDGFIMVRAKNCEGINLRDLPKSDAFKAIIDGCHNGIKIDAWQSCPLLGDNCKKTNQDKPRCYFAHQNNKWIHVQKKYVNLIRSKYPKARFYILPKEKVVITGTIYVDIVYARDGINSTLVGIFMPVYCTYTGDNK